MPTNAGGAIAADERKKKHEKISFQRVISLIFGCINIAE